MSEKVVFLAFSNDTVKEDHISVRACWRCRNKTFILMDNGPEAFCELTCSVCTHRLGKIGWVKDEDN